MRTAFVFNPSAETSVLAEQKKHESSLEAEIIAIMRAQGMEPEIYYTTVEDPGEKIAAQLAAEHVALVVAVGGDGTIQAVARGLFGSESVLGILPAGTMNNLARSLDIPVNLQEACALFASGDVRAIDVGQINGHLFLEVAGVGLDAAIFPHAEEVKHWTLQAIIKGAWNGLRAVFSYKAPIMTLAFDNQKPRMYHAVEVTVCNAPYYGLHLHVAPDIYMNDGWLDVIICTALDKFKYIRHALSVSQGRRAFTSKTIRRRVKTLRVSTSPEAAVEIHADGTVCGSTPADIKIIPAALKVRVPRGFVSGLQSRTAHSLHA